jgi:hypothetical protein
MKDIQGQRQSKQKLRQQNFGGLMETKVKEKDLTGNPK